MAYARPQGKPYEARRSRPSTTHQGHPSVLLAAEVVTKDNVKDTVIKDKFYTTPQICSPTSPPPASRPAENIVAPLARSRTIELVSGAVWDRERCSRLTERTLAGGGDLTAKVV